MKNTNNPFKIFLAILIVGIIGTALVKFAEHIFGMTNVFVFSMIVVAFFGIVVVPVLQFKEHKRKNSPAYVRAKVEVLKNCKGRN